MGWCTELGELCGLDLRLRGRGRGEAPVHGEWTRDIDTAIDGGVVDRAINMGGLT